VSTRWLIRFSALGVGVLIASLVLTALPGVAVAQAPTLAPPNPIPTLADFWAGRAEWAIEVADTGLPVGESDTLYMGDGVYWSYLHASTQSAGVLDSCGGEVAFPGCVTRWVSTDGGQHFSLDEPRCLLACDSCPCDADDLTAQQQYPRVARAPSGMFYMAFEHHAQTFLTRSADGVHWARPWWVRGTGVWSLSEGYCPPALRIHPHPFWTPDDDCMAGGPPGLIVSGGRITVFVDLGQNPGHMGCFQSAPGNDHVFWPCSGNPLFSGASEYGPLDALDAAANPYFDFRYITSADVLAADGMLYMTYEGVRGPGPSAGGDSQFALGFARSPAINGPWQEYPGNPALGDVAFNWGVGHADLVIVDGVAYLYTASPDLRRARYTLIFR